MCGIAGRVSSNAKPADLSGFSKSTLEDLSCRGPDGSGVKTFELDRLVLELIHTRLAIIGPDEFGAQPMSSASGDTTIVFNGEIYNFEELRQKHLQHIPHLGGHKGSDTAVLVELWEKLGSRCLAELKGMWSFAVFQKTSQTLTLVRDQFGIKPLYFSHASDEIRFSSSFASFPASKRNLNLRVVLDFVIEDRYDRGEFTFDHSVSSLKPGHLIQFHLNKGEFGQEIQSRWSKSLVSTTLPKLSFEDSVSKMRSLFFEAVEAELLSDRPLAFALSGGIDSSSIVAVARRLRKNLEINTFTYAHKGFENDESKWARALSEQIGTIHHEVSPSKKEFETHLPRLVLSQGQPIDHPRFLAQYMVFRAVKEAGFSVLIEGQGADEVLGGYHGYPIDKAASMLRMGNLLGFVELLLSLKGLGRSPSTVGLGSLLRLANLPRTKKFRWELIARNHGVPLSILLDTSKPEVHRILAEELPKRPRIAADYYNHVLEDSATFDLLPRILRHGDANAMAHSIENRVPFLYQPFAQFAINLPHQWLFPGGWKTKWIFREAMRGIVPDKILDRRDKIGFDASYEVLETLPSPDGSRRTLEKWGLEAITADSGVQEIEMRKRLLAMWLDIRGEFGAV